MMNIEDAMMRFVVAISGTALMLGGCAGTDRTQTEHDQAGPEIAFNRAHTAVLRVDGMT